MKKRLVIVIGLVAVCVTALVVTPLGDFETRYAEQEIAATPLRVRDVEPIATQTNRVEAAPEVVAAQQSPGPSTSNVHLPALSPAIELNLPARIDEPRSQVEAATVSAKDLGDRHLLMSFAGLPAQFDSEGIDPHWAGSIEARILDHLALYPGLVLRSLDVECRVTTCRIQLTTPDGSIPRLQFENLLNDSDSAHAMIFAIDQNADEVPTATIFLSRGGTSTTQSVRAEA